MQLCYQYLNYSNYYTLGIKMNILMLYTPIYSGPTTLCFEKQEAGVDVVKEKSIFRLMQAGGG